MNPKHREYAFKRFVCVMTLLAVLVTCAELFGGEVEVKVAENPVPQGSFGVVSVKLDKGDQVAFQVFPAPTKREQVDGKLFLNGPTGTKYTVLITVVNFGDGGGKKRFDTGSVEVAIGGEIVPPDVEPDTNAATLTNKVKAAYKQEVESEKPLIGTFALLYAKYAQEAELSKYATWGDLDAAMRKEIADSGAGGKLIKVQTVVGEFLKETPTAREQLGSCSDHGFGKEEDQDQLHYRIKRIR
jgi:hypothetical protein